MSDHIEHLVLLAAQAGAIVIGTQADIETGVVYLLFKAPLSGALLAIEADEFATYQAIKDKIDAADAWFHIMEESDEDESVR
jgi:hypothetical protein